MEWEYLVTSDRQRVDTQVGSHCISNQPFPMSCPWADIRSNEGFIRQNRAHPSHWENYLWVPILSVELLMWLCIISMWTLWPNRERVLDKYFPLVFAVCKYGGGKTWGIWSHVRHQCLTMFDSWFWKSSMESCLIYLNWLQIACFSLSFPHLTVHCYMLNSLIPLHVCISLTSFSHHTLASFLPTEGG